jgi:acyl-CoA thioester hydrolase
VPREHFRFFHRFRVRYAEVDAQAVVFNSRYLEYADMLVTEFWRSRGLSVTGADALEVHIRKATVEFMQPIRLDDEIDGYVRVNEFGRSSMVTRIELHGVASEDLRASVELVQVHVDLTTGKSRPLPESVVRALSN